MYQYYAAGVVSGCVVFYRAEIVSTVSINFSWVGSSSIEDYGVPGSGLPSIRL